MSPAHARKPLLGNLDARSVSRLVEVSSDIALVLDDAGTILDFVVQDPGLPAQTAQEWIGRPWVQTVTADSRQKVEALLRDATAAASEARWRQVNHPVKDGDDLPLLYAAVRLDQPPDGHAAGRTGRSRAKAGGRIVAFGRNLRATVALQQRLVEAQQAMERDYWRFREAETRYRHLFQTSGEAVLIVDGLTQKVLEANPAAQALCGDSRGKLVGAALPALFDARAAEPLQTLLAAARSIGSREPVRALCADRVTEVLVSASVFRQDDNAFVLVRLTRLHAATAPTHPSPRGTKATAAAIGSSAADTMLRVFVQNAADALVFTDAQGRVLSANRSFVGLTQTSAEDQVRGQMLDRWVGRTGVELGVLITNLRQRGSVGLFVTAVRGEYGASTEVEIAASALPPADEPVLAFAIRNIERRLKSPAQQSAPITRSADDLAELVGNVPLKEIVSETTDLIEQLCIETALEMTGDNRASAALLLGLSRQSLYVKLRRFGLADQAADEET
jgi:transcriptional regulator PpsR